MCTSVSRVHKTMSTTSDCRSVCGRCCRCIDVVILVGVILDVAQETWRSCAWLVVVRTPAPLPCDCEQLCVHLSCALMSHQRPSVSGTRVPRVSCREPQCNQVSRVRLDQSANSRLRGGLCCQVELCGVSWNASSCRPIYRVSSTYFPVFVLSVSVPFTHFSF